MKREDFLERATRERPTYVSQLAEEIIKQRLVVFVGAGCSMGIGLPSWTELLDEIIDNNNIKTNEHDPLKKAARLERELEVIPFREKVVERLKTDIDIKSPLHDAIVELDARLFITTNYDHILENSFMKRGIDHKVVTDSEEISSIIPTMKTIVKLHGDIDSPMSIVLTDNDYRLFKKNARFINWFNNSLVDKTILFLGTSFSDPRLKEMDDYILNLYEVKRSHPYIIAKIPEKKENQSCDDFAVSLEDFEFLCKDFSDRHFNVILVADYKEIPDFLKDLSREVRRIKEREGILFGANVSAYASVIEPLEKKLKDQLHKRVAHLSGKIYKCSRRPSNEGLAKYLEELEQLLDEDEDKMSYESRFEAEVSLIEGLINSHRESDESFDKERLLLERAAEIERKIADKNITGEKLLRLEAKLLYWENKLEEAVKLLENSNDPKTISFWLDIIIVLNKSDLLDQAYNFVRDNEVQLEWAPMACAVYILKEELNKAEKLFFESLNKYEKIKQEKAEETSVFLDRLFLSFIQTLSYKFMRSIGDQDELMIDYHTLNDKQKTKVNKIIEFANLFKKKTDEPTPVKNRAAYKIAYFELQAYSLLKDVQKLKELIESIFPVKPLRKVLVYKLLAISSLEFPDDFKKQLIQRIPEELPDDAFKFIATSWFESQFFCENHEKAWNSLKRAFELPFPEFNKTYHWGAAATIGHQLKKLDEIIVLIDNIPNMIAEEKTLFKAYCYYLKNEFNEAVEIIEGLDESELDDFAKAIIRMLKARRKIHAGNLQVAKSLLEESCRFKKFYDNLALYIDVLNWMNVHPSVILAAIEDIEDFGVKNDNLSFIRARAYLKLMQNESAEDILRDLVKNEPENKKYTLSLAQALYFQDKKGEALNEVMKFAGREDLLDRDCILLAAKILEENDKIEEAFNLIDKWKSHFDSDVEYLKFHYRIGGKTGRPEDEEKSFDSIKKLEKLSEERGADVVGFFKKDISELEDFARGFHQTRQGLRNMYAERSIPRVLLAKLITISLYLDWAHRTEENVNLIGIPLQYWPDYSIYATDYFFIDKTKNDFETITVPAEIKEIVVDYHALISFHQLGLLEKLQRRFKKIYYPEALIRIWKEEIAGYAELKPGKISIYKKLKGYKDKGYIIEAKAPGEFSNDPLIPTLRLANLEKFPIVDNVVEEGELVDFKNVSIVRISRLIDWMYEKGRLTEKRWTELKRYSEYEKEVVDLQGVEQISNSRKFAASDSTLVMLEEYKVLEVLIDMGIKIYIEISDGRRMDSVLDNVEALEQVSRWQKDLEEIVKSNPKFSLFHVEFEGEVKNLIDRGYDVALLSAVRFSEDNDLSLLTDDRYVSSIRFDKSSNQRFSTPTLLKDMHREGYFDDEEYAESVLKLYSWRYRFIVPDPEVLFHFAKEYRQALPGDGLKKIAKYCQESLNDPGLLIGLEDTKPPKPLGLHYYEELLKVWLLFLRNVWLEESIDDENKNNLTDWFFKYGWPDIPERFHPKYRSLYLSRIPDMIAAYLRMIILVPNNHMRLAPFIQKTLTFLNKDIDEELKNIILFVTRDAFPLPSLPPEAEEDRYKQLLARWIYESFFGMKFEDYLKRQKKSDLQVNPLHDKDFSKEELSHFVNKLDEYQKRQKEIDSVGIEPLIDISSKVDVPTGEYPHELLLYRQLEVKRRAIEIIEDSKDISDFNKNKVKGLNKKLLSTNIINAQYTADECRALLQKDFKYLLSLVKISKQIDLNIHLANFWPKLLEIDLESAKSEEEIPLLLKVPFEIKEILGKIQQEILGEGSGVISWLDKFVDNCFFIPVGGEIQPGRLLSLKILSKIKSAKAQYSNNAETNEVGNKKNSLGDYLHKIKSWTQKNSDPLGLLLILDLVLNLRSDIQNMDAADIEEFEGDEFKRFLNHVIDLIFCDVNSHTDSMSRDVCYRWNLRKNLAKYFLKYIDIYESEYDDERKVVFSWWLAQKVESVTWDVAQEISPQEPSYVIDPLLSMLKDKQFKIGFRHLFLPRKPGYSIAGYNTLNEHIPLATLFFSIVDPDNPNSNAYNGMLVPSEAFRSDLIELSFQPLLNPETIGDEQLVWGEKSKLHFLWEKPAGKIAPTLFKKYYGDSYRFLGKLRVDGLDLVSELRDVNNFKRVFSDWETLGDDEFKVVCALKSLYVNTVVNGKLLEEASFLEGNKGFIEKIAGYNPPLNHYSFLILADIIRELLAFNKVESAYSLINLLKSLNTERLFNDESSIERFFATFIEIISWSGDIELLKPFLEKSYEDKFVWKLLINSKKGLEEIISDVPFESRKNIQKILQELENL